MPSQTNEPTIVDVWNNNIGEIFRKIRVIVQKYNYVAMPAFLSLVTFRIMAIPSFIQRCREVNTMLNEGIVTIPKATGLKNNGLKKDTEFPGIVARPIGEFRSNSEYQYQLHRCNVDLLKIIQLGITFMDEHGNFPQGGAVFQFNFKFNLNEDMYAQDSIDLLTNSGIQFKKHEEDGIEVSHFAELLMMSGIILSEKVKWITFHSGYDFAYLLKVLTASNLPSDETEFFELLRIYFARIYDVKYLMKSCKDLKGGLQEVADILQILRIGPQHQAGSDSLLTMMTFMKMRESYFEDNIDDDKYCGHLYGLGSAYVQNGTPFSEENNSTT